MKSAFGADGFGDTDRQLSGGVLVALTGTRLYLGQLDASGSATFQVPYGYYGLPAYGGASAVRLAICRRNSVLPSPSDDRVGDLSL